MLPKSQRHLDAVALLGPNAEALVRQKTQGLAQFGTNDYTGRMQAIKTGKAGTKDLTIQLAEYLRTIGFEWDPATKDITHAKPEVIEALAALDHDAQVIYSQSARRLIADVLDPASVGRSILYPCSYVLTRWDNIARIVVDHGAPTPAVDANEVKELLENLIRTSPQMQELGTFNVTVEMYKNIPRFTVVHADYPELSTTLTMRDMKTPEKVLTKYLEDLKQYRDLKQTLAEKGVPPFAEKTELTRRTKFSAEGYNVDFSQGSSQALIQLRAIARALDKKNQPVKNTGEEKKTTPEVPADPLPINADPITLVLDANILVSLRRFQETNSNVTFLGLIEELLKLPNVTVVVPDTIASLEVRGESEDWGYGAPDSTMVRSRTVNTRFMPDRSDKREEAEILAREAAQVQRLFHKAHRIKLYEDGRPPEIFAPKKGANPRLIICETDICREIKEKIRLSEVDRASLKKGFLKEIFNNDAGEKAIDAFLTHMPMDTPAIVLCDENGYDKWGAQKTNHGKPIHHAGIVDLLNAMRPNQEPGMVSDCDALSAEAKALLKKITDAGERFGESNEGYRPREVIHDPSAESLAAVVARGRALLERNINPEPPFQQVIDEHRKRLDTQKEQRQFRFMGMQLTDMIADRKIGLEALTDELNRLNKVDVEPKSPALTVEVLRSYLTGKACPDQDTMYALLEVLVWQSTTLKAEEKKSKTKEMLDAWQERETLDVAALSAQPSTDTTWQDRYHRLGDLMLQLKGDNVGENQLMTKLGNRKPVAFKNSEDLKRSLGSTLSNNRTFVVNCVRAIDVLAKESGGISYEDKISLFNMMLDAQNGNGRHA